MKRIGNIAVCLAGGLAMNAGVRATELAATGNSLPDNPYAAIVVRNIFGLVPPPPPPDPKQDEEKNLPKITPTGIMTVFGHAQVLFKVAGTPAKPGQPPTKDAFYNLSQGQRQDDIEVVKIDGENNLVTFDNHGFTQELPLVNTPASSTPAAGSSPGGMNPGMVQFQPGGGGNSGANNGAGSIIRFGAGSSGRPGSMGNSSPGFNNPASFSGGGGNAANSGVALNFGASTQGRIYQPEAPTMSAQDAQAILIINHLKAQMAGDPTANLYPPTPHDQEAGINSNSQ